MNIDKKAKLLKNYICKLHTSNEFIKELPSPYNHMGATIADAILQAGINWERVVWPRVQVLLNNYPEAKTTKGFLNILESKSMGPNKLLNWPDEEKPKRVLGITKFFTEEGINTAGDLKSWLEKDANIMKIKRFRGIKDKTASYFKILAGIPDTAVDRHIVRFLKRAGIDIDINNDRGLREAKEIVNRTADMMKIDRSQLDYSIWKYMSGKKYQEPCRPPAFK